MAWGDLYLSLNGVSLTSRSGIAVRSRRPGKIGVGHLASVAPGTQCSFLCDVCAYSVLVDEDMMAMRRV